CAPSRVPAFSTPPPRTPHICALSYTTLFRSHRSRRRLDLEGERTVLVHGDDGGYDHPGLRRRPLVKSLHKLHDVDGMLAQGRPYRRRGSRLSCRNLHLDDGPYLLRHESLPPKKPRSAPHAAARIVPSIIRQPPEDGRRLPHLLHLIKIELDRGLSPEHRDYDTQLAALDVHFLDLTVEVLERP